MDSETGKINVENLLSNRVYRIWINIVDSGIGQSKHETLGYIPYPYYWVTNWPSDSDKKRQIIVRDALQHYYYTRKGWQGNMDCWRFCQHHSQDQITKWNRRTHYGSSIPQLAKTGAIHGDYVRIPDYHSFLILSYDAKSNIVWSVEGNFASTIEIVKRRLDSSWWVSHQL